MRRLIFRWMAVCAIMLVTGCGGGGDDGTPGGGEVTPPLPAADSYWTMDAHTYLNGGHSEQAPATLGGRPHTIVLVSTATLAGGDQSNGAYSGSSLAFTFLGNAAGTYTVVPDRPSLLAAPDGSKVIFIESMVGIAVTTGATVYAAASGQVEVTKDAEGVYHLSTPDELRTVKTMDVEGGVSGAPATMQLKIHNAH